MSEREQLKARITELEKAEVDPADAAQLAARIAALKAELEATKSTAATEEPVERVSSPPQTGSNPRKKGK